MSMQMLLVQQMAFPLIMSFWSRDIAQARSVGIYEAL